MASYYLYDKDVNKLLSVTNDATASIQMRSPFNSQINERIYFEDAGQSNGTNNGFYMYVIIDGKPKYFTISNDITNDSKIPDNNRYKLLLKDEKSTDPQLKKRQWWVFMLNLGYKDGFFQLFPTRRIRSNLELNFANNATGRDDHYVCLTYDSDGNILLTNIDSLTDLQRKETCTFLMDNRQFIIASRKANKLNLAATDNSANPPMKVPSTSASNRYWRLEPVDQNYHFWGGKYYIFLPDDAIPSTNGVDKRLFADNTGIAIKTTEDLSTNSQWVFVFILDAKACLIKNVATGKFLSVNASDNTLTMEDDYDATDNNKNTPDNKRKSWTITSVNIPPTE